MGQELKVVIDQINMKNAQFIKSEDCHNSNVDELEKQIISLKEEKQNVQNLYNAISLNCKNLEYDLNAVQKEYDEYKVSMINKENQIIEQYQNEQKEKEKIYDENLNKAVEQNQSLKE